MPVTLFLPYLRPFDIGAVVHELLKHGGTDRFIHDARFIPSSIKQGEPLLPVIGEVVHAHAWSWSFATDIVVDTVAADGMELLALDSMELVSSDGQASVVTEEQSVITDAPCRLDLHSFHVHLEDLHALGCH